MNKEEIMRFRLGMNLHVLQELCLHTLMTQEAHLKANEDGSPNVYAALQSILDRLDKISVESQEFYLASDPPLNEYRIMLADEFREMIDRIKQHAVFVAKTA